MSSSFHRFKHLGPYNKSATIVFRYYSEYSIAIHIAPTDSVAASVFVSESNSIFKVPAGFTATIEIYEVSVSDTQPGRYVFNCTLHPAETVENMTATGTLPVSELEDPPTSSICQMNGGACAGQSNGNCGMSQRPVCEDGMLQCVDDEAE